MRIATRILDHAAKIRKPLVSIFFEILLGRLSLTGRKWGFNRQKDVRNLYLHDEGRPEQDARMRAESF